VTDLSDHFAELRAALAAGEHDQARAAATRLANRAAEDFPTLHNTLNLLGYHGELALINEVMAIAWPQVQEAASYSRPAAAAYASRATDHLIYEFLDQHSEAAAPGEKLLDALERYFAVDAQRLETYFAFLRGETGRRWAAADFAGLDPAALGGLLVEFTGLAHRAGVSYGKAHLVREALPRYFLDRQAGFLHPREDVAALLRSGQRPPPAATGEPLHPLLPDRLTMRTFLQKMLQTVDPQYYPAAAVAELLPLWLRFLRARSLISDDQYARAVAELDGLAVELEAAWREADDPLLLANLV
jgi:hypothetical protein